MTRRQCVKCPWKVDTDPFDIPNGYCPSKHRGLSDTIARDLRFGGGLRIMACHETEDTPCAGWLVNQLGPGNNIALRLAVMSGAIDADVELVGDQHERFEDTLP